jgi:hypothetical protein
MKVKHMAAVAAFVAVLSPLESQAAPPQFRFVDARAMDVAGVKLGMDYNQALAAAAAHFGVTPDKIKPEQYPHKDDITGQKLPRYFNYEKDGVSLEVSFEVRLPADKAHPLAVAGVRYAIPWTNENQNSVRRAALEKYGSPTGNFGGVTQWCDTLENPRNPGMGCSMAHAKLWLGPLAGITLEDPSYHEAILKYINEQKSRKPNF